MNKLLFSIILILNTNMLFASENESLGILKNRLIQSVGAHQGGLFGHSWPNTLGAFKYSKEIGADIIEMDLHTTKDGIVVVFHDDDLKMFTKCKGKVHDKTLAELRSCRFRFSKNAVIPTFEEVLSWANGNIIVDAEFKDFESIKPALDLVEKYNSYAWTYFQTQNNREKYKTAHEYNSKVGLLYAIRNSDDLAWALTQDDELLIVEVNPETRSEQVIDQIHQSGKLVTEDAWHFSKSFEIFHSSCDKAFDAKIDIAISNRPKGCVRQKYFNFDN
jgi:hypothetical protein